VLKSTSISRRIIFGVLLAQLISAIGMSVTSVFYERHVHFQAFDVMLHGRAESLLGAVVDADDADDNLVLDTRSITIPKADLFEVQDNNGRLLGRSQTWPQAITAEKVLAGSKKNVYQTLVNQINYRFVRLNAVRIVDPGEHGGVTHNITVLYGSPTTHVWREIREAVRFYSVLSLVLLVSTAVLVAWFLRHALSPLHKLTSEAAGISVTQWSFNPPDTARSTRELAPLTRAIETSLARLEQSFNQQRQFMSDAAHELKTDVAIIKSSLQLLTMKDRSAQDYRHGLEVCLDDCTRLENTVLQMLTLARVEYESAHSIPLSGESTDIGESVEESIRKFTSFAELRNVSIKFAGSAATKVGLSTDECSLITSNLLHNALQHSPPESTITINLIETEGFLTMSVQDEGEGIPEQVLPHIFEPFFRADASRDRKNGGTGLGLAICKAICDRAGGSISIASVVNIGTQVSVRLPSQLPLEA
jgi:signal transduction histidine kinase